MITIRASQMKVFQDIKTRGWLEDYLRGCYPHQTATMGRPALADLVGDAMLRATAHGYSEPRDLRKYVHICFLLGAGFEDNPASDWAGRIMRNPNYKTAASRLRAIEDGMLKLLEKQPTVKADVTDAEP